MVDRKQYGLNQTILNNEKSWILWGNKTDISVFLKKCCKYC